MLTTHCWPTYFRAICNLSCLHEAKTDQKFVSQEIAAQDTFYEHTDPQTCEAVMRHHFKLRDVFLRETQ